MDSCPSLAAIIVLMPTPVPTANAIIRSCIGYIMDNAVSPSSEYRPIKRLSIILYNACINYANITGGASFNKLCHKSLFFQEFLFFLSASFLFYSTPALLSFSSTILGVSCLPLFFFSHFIARLLSLHFIFFDIHAFLLFLTV